MIEIGKIPAGTIVTDKLLTDLYSAWQASQQYEPTQIVFTQRPRPRIAIWWDRIRMLRWDVPDVTLERYQAS